MSKNPRTDDIAPRPRSAPPPVRRVTLAITERPARRFTPARPSTPAPPSTPGLLDAVRDQHDALWFRYGTPERAQWRLVSDLARPEGIATLFNLDPRLIEAGAQRALRRKVSRTRAFRPALVAASPGWTGPAFVCGDGFVLRPAKGASEVIVTFGGDPKFAPHGTLEGWQRALAPVAAHQSRILFGLALAFVGPLLPFVPPDYLSPFFEIVGAPGTGKSTVGVAAVSVWAGDREETVGGGETWNVTPGSFDALKLSHRHSLLLLDEANLAGATHELRRQLIHHAVFGLTTTSVRRRMGDPPNKPNAHLAVLSTSNRRLADLIEGSPAERGAMHERMITIPVVEGRPHGVLDTVPAGFASAVSAIEALRAAAQEHWGTAGPAFVRALQRKVVHDEEGLRALLARGLAYRRDRLSAVTDLPRVQKSLALVSVAGQLASRWGILPPSWGCPASAVRSVAEEALREGSGLLDPRKLVRAYVARKRAGMIEVATLRRPLTRAAFEATSGFLRRGPRGEEVLIPSARFQAAFPEHEAVMRALRARAMPGPRRGRPRSFRSRRRRRSATWVASTASILPVEMGRRRTPRPMKRPELPSAITPARPSTTSSPQLLADKSSFDGPPRPSSGGRSQAPRPRT